MSPAVQETFRKQNFKKAVACMTKEEWLAIGYDKRIIEDLPDESCVSFMAVYKQWFVMKMHKIKADSLDRIEVTYNRYYRGAALVEMPVHLIDKDVVCAFLNSVIVNNSINQKEFGRIWQIVNNVLVYAHDMSVGYAQLIDWGFVKRYVYNCDIVKNERIEYMIPDSDRRILFHAVLVDNIYPLKRSACLLLLMNFYLGLRIGELASLKFCDFDINNKVVKIYKTEIKYFPRDNAGERAGSIVYDVIEDVKTRTSFRVMPLTDECISIYKMICAHHKEKGYSSEFLCYDGADTIMTRSLERTLTRLCELLGISHINSHKIRKTFASLLHVNGVPTRVITDLCGHSDMETTEKCYILNYEAGYSAYMGRISYALSNEVVKEIDND